MWICPFSALVGQKKTFVSWLAKEWAKRGAVNPRSPQGRGSEHGAHDCAARSCTSGIDRRSRTEPRVRPETNVERGDQPKAAPNNSKWGRAKAGNALSDIGNCYMYRKDPRRRIYVAAGLNHGYSVYDPRGRSNWCDLPQVFHRAYPATRKPLYSLTPARCSTMSLLSVWRFAKCSRNCTNGTAPSRLDTRSMFRSCPPQAAE